MQYYDPGLSTLHSVHFTNTVCGDSAGMEFLSYLHRGVSETRRSVEERKASRGV